MSGFGLRNSVLREGDDPRRQRGSFGENMCPTSLTPYELRIGLVHAAAHNRGRRLIASVGQVYYRPRTSWGSKIAHRGRSLISTTALLRAVIVSWCCYNSYCPPYVKFYQYYLTAFWVDQERTLLYSWSLSIELCWATSNVVSSAYLMMTFCGNRVQRSDAYIK